MFPIIYKPPDSSNNAFVKTFTTKLLDKIEKTSNERKETMIMGDLNYNYLNDNDQDIKDIFATNSFIQLPNTPTRITAQPPLPKQMLV